MKLLVRVVVAFVAMSSSVTFAGKPAPPPPPPPPAGCAGIAGIFPSIVFDQQVNAANGSITRRDTYVGNSAGTCAVKVYSVAGNAADPKVSMAFDGAVYRIVWFEQQSLAKNGPLHSVVKMVQFQVDANQSIIEPLPLSARTLYTDPSDKTAAAFYDLNISSGGNAVVFARKLATRIELDLLDISACTSSCTPSVAISDSSYSAVSGAVFGAGPTGTNRIYFTAKKLGTDQAWGLYFLEKNSSGAAPQWIGPRLVASMADPLYAGDPNNAARQIYWPRTTHIMVDGASDEVVSFSAHTRDLLSGAAIDGVDVVDVTHCASSGTGTGAGTGSCLDNNEAIRLDYNIPGQIGSGGWKGDGSILTMNYTGTLNGDMWALDPFGMQSPVDHGPGLLPDGIK